MCPPASIPPAVELDEYSTEEVVFKSLIQFKKGCSLPANVISDVDPYQFIPSNLPDNIWYFWSGTKKDAENGFWKSMGEACEIYSTSATIGLRKTLQYFEGPTPDGQKTNWMMQEYTTTEKFSSKLDPRALYRVFLVDDSSGGSRQVSKSELLEKNIDGGAGPSAMANQSPDPPSAVAANQSPDDRDCVSRGEYLEINDLLIPLSPTTSSGDWDYVSRGDYLEMNDLLIPLSRSTSSGDSSCMTMSMTSEDLFDSALLHKIGNDTVDQGSQDSRTKLNISAPGKLKEVIMQPATLGTLNSGEESKLLTGQTSKTSPPLENKPQDHKNESTSHMVDTSAAASSSSSEGSPKEEKKDRAKKRKMIKYLCFLAF